jgi:hypothetical protein
MEQQQQPMVGKMLENVGMRTMFGLLLGVPGESMVSGRIFLEHARLGPSSADLRG